MTDRDPHSAQTAYLGSLEAKRDAAFAVSEHEYQIEDAWAEWTATHPQWTDAHRPCSPAPRVDWAHVRFMAGVGLFCAGVWAGVVWMAWRAVTR